ncbi:ADP-ribosyltransferase, partial [Streptomyces sp. NPDC052023]|uniref:ADP-ribosyltransferase n=1 Tax=Streptomyces sp. NPDC052023 TaxID=3365681 RepID=UPI0037D76E43
GLGTLVGFGGWDAMGQAWKGLAQLATGLALTSIPGVGTLFWALPDDKLPSWIRDSRTAMKETGKALVAWDQWGKNPARAAGAVTFNVLTTVFTGGAGAGVAGAGKAGAVARVLGTTAKVIDPMTYIAKGAGAGLSKIGDIATSLKGVGTIDIPTLPDGSVQLPDGRLMDPNGNLVAPNGVIDTTPVPHETGQAVPHGTATPTLPAHWTLQGQQPVYAGDGMAHTVDNAGHHNYPASHNAPAGQFGPPPTSTPYGHVPSPSAYDHAPSPSAYDQTPTTAPHTGGQHPGGTPWYHQTTGTNPVHDVPHTGGPDVPGPGGHTPDTPHAPAHDLPGSDHADDASHGAGHTDDMAYTGDHVDLDPTGLGDDVVDAAAHHGTDAPVPPGHQGTDVPGSGAGEPFEYKPTVSTAEFDALSDAQKHAVAEAELARGTNPAPSVSNAAGLAYGNAYWDEFMRGLDPETRSGVVTYTGSAYDPINNHLRFGTDVPQRILDTIRNMDEIMDARPVPEDIMVVRGTGVDHVKVNGLPIESPLDMIGGTFDDKAFTSTALGKTPPPPFDQKPVWMHLRVPKDTPALWLEPITQVKGERELLLAKGSEYKVTRVFYDEAHGKWHIYGEVLPRPKP